MNYPKYKVYVSCMTFNQAKFITDALNGFTMQQTTFPFVCTIVDDASTDGEQEVISKYVEKNFDLDEGSVSFHKETEYAHITYAQHKKNRNCYFAILYLKENHYSKKKDKCQYLKEWIDGIDYVAICEGDDYWIDSSKLQKQIDFLDSHKDCSMCFHRAAVLDYIGKDTKHPLYFETQNRVYSSDELFKDWIVPTCSIICRKDCLTYPIKGSNRISSGDIFLVLSCAAIGEVWGMTDFMSVYRISYSGVTYNAEHHRKAIMNYPEHMECIRDNFPKLNKDLIDGSVAWFYYERSKYQDKWQNKCHDLINAVRNKKSLIKLIVISTIKKILFLEK